MKKILLIVLFITGVCFGQTHEFAEEFYKNGIPKVIKTFKESKGKFELVKSISLHENGQKRLEETWKDGERDGKWTGWHENGQKSSEITYKNGKQYIIRTYKDGKREGFWTWWYAYGQKFYEDVYKDGELIESKKWDRDGNLIED